MISLPDFKKPPVIEVVCGIAFEPLKDLLAPHMGLLWSRFVRDYPKCEEQQPLDVAIESFDKPPAKSSIQRAEFSTVPPMQRIWFASDDDTRLIQVQRDRFLHNWRKTQEHDEYPRYSQVIAMFKDALAQFEAFLSDGNLGVVKALQYELTYVNHIPQGEGWDSLGDIGRLLPDCSWRRDSKRFLPEPERGNLRTSFVLPDNVGRLHVTAQNAVRLSDHREVIRLDLTARGIGPDKGREAMYDWFDVAHEWIVCGFADLTGAGVQEELWERIQ